MCAKPYTSIPDELRDRVVDDLLEKYPKGPRGILRKHHYDVDKEYDYNVNKYRDYVKLRSLPGVSPYFGYDKEFLARIHWSMNRGDYSTYIRDRWDTIGKRARTRRYNRLNRRIARAFGSWKDEEGSQAIYSVRLPFISSFIHVIATSETAARQIARTVAAGAGIVSQDDYKFRVNKTCVPDTVTLDWFRDSDTSTVSHAIKSKKSEIERLRDVTGKLVEFSSTLAEFTESMKRKI